MLGDFFTHPLPKSFNRIEIRAVAREWEEGEAQSGGGGLDKLGSVTRCAIPDDDHGNGRRAEPGGEMMQELDGILLIALAFVPEKALSMRKVIGAIPVDALSERGAIAQPPGGLTRGRPGVAQVHVSMEVRLVDVDQPNLFPTNLGEELLEQLHESRSFGRIGFAEHFLALLPTQTILLQEGVQRIAADDTAKDSFDPLPDLFQAPAMTRYPMRNRCAFLHCLDDLLDLFLGKKGDRPPVRR